MIDRREFITVAARTLLSACVAASLRQAARATAPTASPATTPLDALFDEFMEERFREDPELLTSLGLDKDRNSWAKSRLTDASLAHVRRLRRDNHARLKRLWAFRRDGLSATDRANYETVEFQMETIARSDAFDYGDIGRPYVVSQLTGAYQSIPTFLDSQHQITSKQDADAYLERLRGFAVVLDQETERVRHDAGLKVVPPDFILERTLEQMRTLRAAAPSDSILSTSLARRTQALAIGGSYAEDAARLVGAEVYPALDRQAQALGELRSRATHAAGVSRLPQGEAFYALALRHSTTTGMSAEAVHELGLDQVKEITAAMDALLRSEGKDDGSVADRAEALAGDPQYLFPNTDAGRQRILDYCNTLIKELQPHLPRYFRILPKTSVEIRRVPVYTEAGAPGGYYQRPALDSSRPGAFYINLRDTSEWPRWKLPTLVYHESEPGHHFQLALVLEMSSLPLIRKAGGPFSANTEGWALYAEQLCDEMGLYGNDPLGRLGMLQSALFRAARCVVDTGLHAQGWSRERAIDYLVETTGGKRSSMTTEVERYCTWPGQATSYKVGQTRWLALRAQARTRLSSKFDIRDFHDVGLSAAPMPLAVLERVVDDWLKGQGA